MTVALIAHGGAGKWRPGSDEDAVNGLSDAVGKGREILMGGGSALDAVCATVVVLEDNPIYNAGTGAVLNFDGFCELDACVMESREARVGSVSGLQRVKNPILVARKVMEETDHVMLTGDGAQRFARVMGFGDHDPVTPDRRADWHDKRNRVDEVLGKHALKMRRFLKEHPEYAGGTVGAAAVDSHGILAAATSTGGVTLKLVGRVGDSPFPGAGNYASRHIAASATGTGEYVLRSLATRVISEKVEQGATLSQAVQAVLDQLGRDFDADVGLIAVDSAGTPYAAHRTRDMPHAWFAGAGNVVAKMRA
ncbi:isoaspartyl peptidase/L-asparaginase family protein [Usitatibacter palustris]|uniref:Isoaspartyl peptidase n=1 Tax=Usitatibacter palustris TaxID=2732487 RepID=A0A6M4H991_9PROT|nr:isoaspartyl peptidase/L-asparaginase family protein [Usitatibacter palustris]QJR16309.1 Isoaspartyl peptidase [Usitatibacter palustris]